MSLDVFVDKHIGALKTIKYLLKHGVSVYLKDTRNVWTKTEAKYMPFEKNKKIILDKLNKIVYNRDELIKKLKNVKLSKKTRRKVLAELENKRRRIRKKSRGIKQTGKNSRSGKSQSQVASGRGANQGLKKSKKSITSERATEESGFIVGKKIKWTEKEDKDVEKYIRETRGINKARKTDEEIAGKKLTERQLEKIKGLNKRIFGDENIKITKQILTPEGQKALGVYSDGMIKILDGQADPKDTYYHEVVHKFIDVMTTMDEHKEVLISAKRHFKVKTFEEAEERLAESFINYAKTREGISGKLKLIFDKFLRRFKRYSENKKIIEKS